MSRSRAQAGRAARWLARIAVLALLIPTASPRTVAQAAAGGGPATITPTLVSTIDTSAGGTGARLLLGDVTGDGRLDAVTMQPTYSADDRFIGRQVQALAAFELTGEQVWQVGTPDPRVTNNGTDIPAQIYDIDGDGTNEVLAVMEDQLRIFDGRTARLERALPLPHPEAHDAIIIANFRGTELPRDVVLKDRYDHVWVLNPDAGGEVLWSHAGNTGHYPWPYDFDGDGRQELMAGYDLLGPDGTRRWTAPMEAHADTMWMDDVDGDGRTDIVLGGADTRAYTADGREIWRNSDTIESQQIGIGDFRPDLPGREVAGLDRVDRTPETGRDAIFLLSAQGETIWKEERTSRGCWGTVVEPIHNWDGRHRDHILAWNRGCGVLPGIYDGYGNVVTTFPVDARFVHADVCGDDREEAIGYVMGDRVYVWANGGCDLADRVTGRPLPQAKRLYNYTRYTASETPVDVAQGKRATASSWRWGHAPAKGNDASSRTRWAPAWWDSKPWWRVDLGAVTLLTGVEVTWSPGRRAHRYKVEASTDGKHWTMVVDRTRWASKERQQITDFTALGRYVRITVTNPDGPPAAVGLAGVKVMATR